MSAAERLIGTRLLAWGGAAILVLGIAYFLKYAYDAGWIGPSGRLAIGASLGTIAILAARMPRFRVTEAWAQVVTGIGLAVYYACVYYAFEIYGIWGHGTAFAAAAAVTLLTLLLALKDDAPGIAVLGLVGGFISPVALSTGENRPWDLFGYLALLDLIALAAAAVRRWRILDVLAFAGTAILWTSWYVVHFDQSQVLVGALSVAVFWLIFIGIAVVRGLGTPRALRPEVLLTGISTCTAAFFAWEQVLEEERTALLIALGAVGAALVMASRLVLARVPDSRIGAPALLAQAAGALAIALGISLELNAVVVISATQGLVFAVAHASWRKTAELSRDTRLLGFAAGGAHLGSVVGLAASLPLHANPDFVPVFNTEFLSWMLAAAACFASFGLVLRRNDELDSGFSLLPLLGTAVAMFASHMEILESFGGEAERFEFLSVAALWSLGIVATSYAARAARDRVVGCGAAVLTVIAAFVIVASGLQYPHVRELLFLNPRVLGLFSFAAALLYAGRVAAAPIETKSTARMVTSAFHLVAAATVMLALSWDVNAFCEARDLGVAPLLRMQLVLWSVGGLAVNRLARGTERIEATIFGLLLRFVSIAIAMRYVAEWAGDARLFFDLQTLVLAVFAVTVYLERHAAAELRTGFSVFTQGAIFFAIFYEIDTWSRASSSNLWFLGEVTSELGSGLVSAAWALQAFVLIAVGLFHRRGALRVTGFVVFAIAVGKVLLVDLEFLEQVYRILSFVGTGVLLLAGSYLYHSIGRSLDDGRDEAPAAS